MTTYLYIFESADRKEVYIGIADRMSRVWEPHNPDAEKLRNSPGARILQTKEPFARREDARKAEAIAIYIAARAGQTVRYIDDSKGEEGLGNVETEDNGLSYTNLAGTKTTTVLQPAIHYRPGCSVSYEELTGTALVRISPESIDDRPAPFGGLGGAQFAERAKQWWPLGQAHREHRPIKRLVAVLNGSQIVLGSWDLAEPRFVFDENGWQFVLASPDHDNAGDFKGRTLTFEKTYGFRRLGYSQDLRE